MSDPNTLRVLEVDGGGARGYLSTSFLTKFINLWGIDPTKIAENFDVICGTSVGGMIALSLALGMTPNQIMSFFTTTAPYVFSLTSLTPSIRPNLAAKVALIATDTPFYASSPPFENNYGYGLLKTTIENQFGTNTLQNLKTNVVIPTYKNDTNTFCLCSNINNSSFVGQNELISNVCLATGSAPIYLPPLNLTNSAAGTLNGQYIDGGIYQNNPARFGINLGKIIKPNANRVCVLSIGTGLGEYGFDPGNPSMTDLRTNNILKGLNKNNLKLFNSVATIFGLFNIAATGGQESVAKSLFLESSYTRSNMYYYRFQPTLDKTLNTELDNTDNEIYTYYSNLAETTFNNDTNNITTFLGHLTA
jgi:patatin-like phospholipase/acyl hydrolase